ncbi:MAG: hypothetical protein WDM80_01625 [Limisphaerales bacterium]
MKKYLFLLSPAMVAVVIFTFSLCCARAQAAETIYFSANDIVYAFTPPGPKTNFATLPSFTNPEGLVFDTSGNLFVAGGGNVSKITPNGTVSPFATLPGFGGYGMVIDASNNLYVAGAASLEIKRITPGGTVSTYATLASGSTGLAIDGTGNLYVVGGGYTVKKILAGGGTASDYVTLPGNNNYGLAFDSAGYLYASDITSTTLFKIPPGGGSYSNFGTLDSGAKGLAFDHSGNLYAAQPNVDKISVITPDGTTTNYATSLDGPRYLTFNPVLPFTLRITAVDRFGGDLRLSFTSLAGTNYAIQSRADLSSGTWVTLGGTTNSGTGGIVQQTLTNALAMAKQFYRVQQLP